ncbi:MAG: hypothetical protein GC181_04485 [Bacteroidetes bacterium]|nr:hypothetical protein [Bacteroidota bacterium]
MHSEQIRFLASSLLFTVTNHIRKIPDPVSKILVIKWDEIGDMVYSLHIFPILKSRFPLAQIHVLCKPVNAAWIGNQPGIDQIITDASECSDHYDIRILLRFEWKHLLSAFTDNKALVYERGIIRLRNKLSGGQRHEVYTNFDIVRNLVEDSDFEMPELVFSDSEHLSATELISKKVSGPFAVMHCGARDEARRWPADRFAEVAAFLNSRFHLKTVLVGSPEESDLNEKVAELTNGDCVINLAGKTTIPEMAVIIDKSELFIGNESGPMHFAVVQQKPLISLFGPGVKDVFYPLYPNQHVIHYFQEKDHTKQTVKNSTILKITVEEVIAQVSEILATSSSAG